MEAAKRGIELNGLTNVRVAAASAEVFVQHWRDGIPVKGLEDLDLRQLDLRTLLVDPPRAGLDPATVDLCREFDRVVYISCNPETLLSNLVALEDTFQISRLALFDQFPFTHHCEAGVLLTKRGL